MSWLCCAGRYSGSLLRTSGRTGLGGAGQGLVGRTKVGALRSEVGSPPVNQAFPASPSASSRASPFLLPFFRVDS